MKRPSRLKRKFNSLIYNHIWLKYLLDYGTAFVMSVLSAFIFAFGVVCFLKPGGELHDFVSGGSSGLAQTFALFLELFGVKIEGNHNLIFSILYLVINIPLVILAFKGIGKRFAIFTIVNVVSVTIFSNIMVGDFFVQISKFINMNGGFLARALFAGVCTGLSSAIAYKFETSAGGFDIVSYYLSLRKSKPAGPYGMAINAFIIITFYVLTAIKGDPVSFGAGVEFSSVTFAFCGILFSLIYLVMTMLIIDLINTRNKKVQLQIITENADLPRLLLANVPHGATVVKAKGAYSGNDRLIIYLVISTNELKVVIHFVKDIDPSSFVYVTGLQQVYGRFFMKPVK